MRFRDPKQNEDAPPKYGSSGLFTLSIHTGGSVHRGINYVGEKNVYKFDHVKRDLFSVDSLKKFAGYMDGSEIEVLNTKNDEGQFEEINTESEFQKYSEKAIREGKELEIYVVSEGKRDSDNSNDSGGFIPANEHASADSDFVDKKEEGGVVSEDVVEEGTGVVETMGSRNDVVVFDDSSGDDDGGESEDDFNSVKDSDSEDEDHNSSIYKQTTVYDPHLELNMTFSNKQEFLDVVHSNALFNKRAIRITKNDKVRVYAKCRGDGCEWEVRACMIPGEETFRIRAYRPTHSCPESFHVKSIKPRLLSLKYGYLFKNDPKRKVTDFKNDMSSELGVHITNHQAYKCRKLALQDRYDSADEQYMLLWDYAQEVRRTNPGSTVVIDSEQSFGSHRFDRMYICLNAVKEGLLAGCRPLIGVDSCHLKGSHKGMLLSAIGVDPNNNIFPIAYAVVSRENGDTWEWFLSVLKVDLKIVDDTIWTFISDKRKGLLQDFRNIFPNSSHRFCVRQLHRDMRNAGFGGQAFKIALYRAAKATTVDEFNRKINDMRELSETPVQWLNDLPPQHWSRSHFNCIPKCDIVMNKLCESYKNSILPGRKMPILNMLEWLMEDLMRKFQRNSNRGKNWKGVLCPRIQKQIDESMKHVEGCIPVKDDDKHYKVRCTDGSQYSVDLENWTCECRKWDLTGIPCIHAIRAICCQGLKPEDFTHACYRVSTYRLVYDHCIMPINARSEWVPYEFIPLLPPVIDRRRKRRRESELVEQKGAIDWPASNPFRLKRNQVTVKCSICHQPGHNKKKCPTLDNYLEGVNNRVNLLEAPPVSEDNHVIKKARKRYVTRSKFFSSSSRRRANLRAGKRYATRSILASLASGKKVNLQEADDQPMQGQTPEDDNHAIKKAGKRYATRSNMVSFASRNTENSEGELMESQCSEDEDYFINKARKRRRTRSNLASFASRNKKSTKRRKLGDHEPVTMDDQLMQRQQSEDGDHVIKKDGKRYATRSCSALNENSTQCKKEV